MNLVTDYINELGGYEVAKKKNTSWLLNHGENWRNVKDATLLEYRRQHNIFKVEDKVVLLKNQHMWHKMESIYTVTSTDIYDGITIGVAIEYKNTSHGNEIGNIRHATDAEIKAGKRLEVK